MATPRGTALIFMCGVGLLQPEVAELDGAAFALECDVTLGGIGGALVLQVTVDINGNLAECFGHESWAPHGKGMYFVKYPVSPQPPKGICYVDLKTREISLLYSGFPYWHVGVSENNRFLLADTVFSCKYNPRAKTKRMVLSRHSITAS